MKTSDLTGAALDWAVAKCEGLPIVISCAGRPRNQNAQPYKYSTDWAQGGPIIEREKIAIRENADSPDWYACKRWDRDGAFGPTPLIAAMRCYVASKLGDEVDVPKELTA
jgi:hypothetical protein